MLGCLAWQTTRRRVIGVVSHAKTSFTCSRPQTWHIGTPFGHRCPIEALRRVNMSMGVFVRPQCPVRPSWEEAQAVVLCDTRPTAFTCFERGLQRRAGETAGPRLKAALHNHVRGHVGLGVGLAR